jgi:hypothetical protein
MTLKAEERKINVSNAFVCQSTALKGKKILLIDDYACLQAFYSMPVLKFLFSSFYPGLQVHTG